MSSQFYVVEISLTCLQQCCSVITSQTACCPRYFSKLADIRSNNSATSMGLTSLAAQLPATPGENKRHSTTRETC